MCCFLLWIVFISSSLSLIFTEPRYIFLSHLHYDFSQNMILRSVRSKFLLHIVGVTLCCWEQIRAFSATGHPGLIYRTTTSSITTRHNWLGDLWEEVIEFSTYGPSERKVLKARREAAADDAASKSQSNATGDDVSMDSFRRAKKTLGAQPDSNEQSKQLSSTVDDDSLSLRAFQSAIVASKEKRGDEEIDFDGYKLRDLLVEKFGVPLDIDFQRGSSGDTVYCSVLPIAFGSSKCRHLSEMDYLMHLQAVVEVLHKYDNLDPFIFFVKKSSRVPKPGIESVPYLMNLDSYSLKEILNG